MYISILQINVFDINFLQYLTQTKRRNGIYCIDYLLQSGRSCAKARRTSQLSLDSGENFKP